ncbi:MAG: S9 family peptidase [Burkholderiaceae bacterium]|nr:S9 family peptidase [Burkholderiaceae bacterium]
MPAPYTVEQHIALKRVASIAPAPDGTWLALVVQRLDLDGAKYVSDLWKVPTDGGPAVQLTRGDCKDVAPCFRHDGALGFLSNRKPNDVKPDEDAEKRMQVWLLPAAGGEPQQITDEPLGVEAFKFAARADRMVLFTPVIAGVPHDKQRETAAESAKKGPSVRRYSRQPVRHWDHWLHQNPERENTHLIVCDASGKNREDLTPEVTREFSIEPHLDLSADGRRVLASWATPGSDREEDSHLLLIDLANTARLLVPQPANSNTDSALFSPDGTTIAAIRATRSPKFVMRPTLTLIDAATGSARELARDWDRWPNLSDWSADGRSLIVTADDDGLVPMFAIDASSGAVRPLTSRAAGGSHSNVQALVDDRVACIRSTLLDAPECFVVDAAAAPAEGAAPTPLARLSGFTPAHAWAECESIVTRSTDGTPIQSWITRPKGAKNAPTLLWIHGGPIGMGGDGWHWRWNALLAAAQGYAVVQPNPRGSTGFGQTFVQGIWGNVWGDQCYQDLMAVTDAIEQRPEVDRTRVMAMGGSFGGYMTNWIGTQTQRFRCLITHASIVTMAQFTGTTDHPAWWYLEMGGEDPYADPASYDRYAPIRYIKNWKTPALIIHGELDYRCPIGEGLNLFEALQYHGVDSELAIFPDENHWILKPRNIVAWYDSVLGFLGKHMA